MNVMFNMLDAGSRWWQKLDGPAATSVAIILAVLVLFLFLVPYEAWRAARTKIRPLVLARRDPFHSYLAVIAPPSASLFATQPSTPLTPPRRPAAPQPSVAPPPHVREPWAAPASEPPARPFVLPAAGSTEGLRVLDECEVVAADEPIDPDFWRIDDPEAGSEVRPKGRLS